MINLDHLDYLNTKLTKVSLSFPEVGLWVRCELPEEWIFLIWGCSSLIEDSERFDNARLHGT